jgi:hypothetical protein
MDFSKYNQVPLEPATAKEIGLAAATLSAMARRGLVEVIPGKPNKYRRIDNPTIKIYQLLEENKNNFDEFFMLRKKDAPYGMLCSLKKGTIMDCWGKEYNLTDVNYLQIGKKEFSI